MSRQSSVGDVLFNPVCLKEQQIRAYSWSERVLGSVTAALPSGVWPPPGSFSLGVCCWAQALGRARPWCGGGGALASESRARCWAVSVQGKVVSNLVCSGPEGRTVEKEGDPHVYRMSPPCQEPS